MILPDAIIFAGVAGAVIIGVLEKLRLVTPVFYVFSANHILTALFFFFVLGAIWYLSKGKWLGFGDAKLMLFIGLIFGAVDGTAILYIAIILGALKHIIDLALKVFGYVKT